MSRRDAAILNCVYVRKSDTHLDRDVGQRPPTLTEVISAPRQNEAHPRDTSFLKDRFCFLFPHTLSKPSSPPFVKTISQLILRVSLLRKNMRQEDSPVSLPSSGRSFVFRLSPSGTIMFYRCTSGPLTTPRFLNIYSFIYFVWIAKNLLVQHDSYKSFVRISFFPLFAVVILFAKIYHVAILENNA